jgi:tetratricopeptide (TPR) repeat protein
MIFFLNLCSYSQNLSNKELFDQAKKVYDEKKYDQAINDYEKIISSGMNNSAVYYNLGNAYFKNKNISKAIKNYYKAIEISPRDKDINQNLQIIKSKLRDLNRKEDSVFEKAAFKFNLNEWYIVSILFFVLSCFSVIIFFKYKNDLNMWFMIFSVLFLLIFGSFFIYRIMDNTNTYAVISSKAVLVKSGPGNDYTTSFELHEGTKIKILRTTGIWSEIEAFGSLRGWLKDNEIEKI